MVVGTGAVREAGKPDWLLATPEMPPLTLKEGHAVRTERGSQALITFFDESALILLPESELAFSNLRVSRFSFFAPAKTRIGLAQKRGKMIVGVAPASDGYTQFEVKAPQGSLSLSEGSYSVDVDSSRARVRVKEGGKAVVTAQNKTVEATWGERIDTPTGEPPRPPESATVELVANGDFRNGLNGWKVDNLSDFPEGKDVLGNVQVAQGGGASAIRFSRSNSKGTHNETYIAQDLNEDVADFTRLQLTIELKLTAQSVSGGGYMGSEYPLLVRVHYRSDQGDAYVIKGFYYQNEAGNRTDNGALVPHEEWVRWTMPDNLMTVLPVPRKITSIEIGASGHDYSSEARRISLSGE